MINLTLDLLIGPCLWCQCLVQANLVLIVSLEPSDKLEKGLRGRQSTRVESKPMSTTIANRLSDPLL